MSTQDSEIRDITERLVTLASQPGVVEALDPADRTHLHRAIGTSQRHVDVPLLHLLFPTSPTNEPVGRVGKIDLWPRHLYAKHLEHFSAGGKFKARAFMAGNRTGKSLSAAYETALHATGWYPDWWDGWRRDEPAEIIVAAKYTKTLKKVPQRALFGRISRGDRGLWRCSGGMLIPDRAIVHENAVFMPAAPGTLNEISVRFRDSKTEFSTIEFFSYEMGRGVFEGTAYDFAWLDEECPEDVYFEVMKRLMTTGGRMVLTWTPLDGLTEVVMQFLGKDYQPPDVLQEDIDALLPPQIPEVA